MPEAVPPQCLLCAEGHTTPQNLDKEISYLHDWLGWTVELMLQNGCGGDGLPSSAGTADSSSSTRPTDSGRPRWNI